jgi:hypothetical protein
MASHGPCFNCCYAMERPATDGNLKAIVLFLQSCRCAAVQAEDLHIQQCVSETDFRSGNLAAGATRNQ